MNATAQSQHLQSQSIAILAIATGAMGFGLLGSEFRVSMEFLPTMQFVGAGYVLVAYIALVGSVRHILESERVTGRRVVQGPLLNMFLLVLYVVAIFVAGILDTPASHLPPA